MSNESLRDESSEFQKLLNIYNSLSSSSLPNPSQYGYHHGPIPNANSSWLPPRQTGAKERGEKLPLINVADVAEPPNPPQVLSQLNSLICDIAIDSRQKMCGKTFSTQPSYRRHLRQQHPGAIATVGRINPSIAERVNGEDTLRLYVLSGGWRNADYFSEPISKISDSYCHQYAEECQFLALNSPTFAKTFGTLFRRSISSQTGSLHTLPVLGQKRINFTIDLEEPSETNKRQKTPLVEDQPGEEQVLIDKQLCPKAPLVEDSTGEEHAPQQKSQIILLSDNSSSSSDDTESEKSFVSATQTQSAKRISDKTTSRVAGTSIKKGAKNTSELLAGRSKKTKETRAQLKAQAPSRRSTRQRSKET